MDVREMDSSNTTACSLIVAQNLNSDMINGLSVSALHKGVKRPEYCNEEKSSAEQTAEYSHRRMPSAEGHHRDLSQTKAGMVSSSLFRGAALLCMDPNYDVAGFNFVVTHTVTPCSSHHHPPDCWHPLSCHNQPLSQRSKCIQGRVSS